jgi:hypothetical protein
LTSIVLTSFIGAYYLSGFGHDSRLVKTLSEYIFDEGVWRYVVTANTPVDILQQPPPLFNGDVALQDSCGAPLIKFPI